MTQPVLEGFEIVRKLGRGTTGVAYQANDRRLNRVVALKLLWIDDEAKRATAARRFLCEAQMLACLTAGKGSNIPAIHEVGESQGNWFHCREYVEGRTLEEVADSGMIPLREGIGALKTVAETIHRVHARGFAHRNLHPANILVATDGTTKLIGFGRFGLLTGSDLLPPGTEGVPLDVDLRALERLLRWLCNTLREPVPRGLEAVLRRCATHRATAAYKDAGEFEDALADFLQEGGENPCDCESDQAN